VQTRRDSKERRVAWPLLHVAGRRDIMPTDIVLLHIVIALGIIALAARLADGGK